MSWDNHQSEKPQNIQERALEYGVRAVTVFRFLQKQGNIACSVIAKQYIRSATSIGANMEEASAAETKADFIHKVAIAQKEARESLYWLRLMARAELVPASRIEELISETRELVAITTAIAKNARKRSE